MRKLRFEKDRAHWECVPLKGQSQAGMFKQRLYIQQGFYWVGQKERQEQRTRGIANVFYRKAQRVAESFGCDIHF